MTAVIKWVPASTLPDSETTVLIACDSDEPVWLGYHDGEVWRVVEGEQVRVTHWADLPEGPR